MNVSGPLSSPNAFSLSRRTFRPKALLMLSVVLSFACMGTGRRAHTERTLPTRPDLSLLTANDLHLVTEAMAYDMAHGPHVASMAAPGEGRVALALSDLPSTIAMQPDVAFPKEAFVTQWTAAVRNSALFDVVPPDSGADPRGPTQHWSFVLQAAGQQRVIEGSSARIYDLTAKLVPGPNRAPVWQKTYTIRKRVDDAIHAGPDAE